MKFEPLKIADKRGFVSLLSQRYYENSWLTFGNLFIWRHAFATEWAKLPEGVLVKFRKEDQDCFLPPLLLAEASFAGVVDRIAAASLAAGRSFIMLGVSAAMAAEVERVFPGKYKAEAKRDRFDYLYRAEDLRQLAGRRYHAKRNFTNRFRGERQDWRYEPLTAELAQECIQVAETWCGGRDCDADTGLAQEYDAICEAFRHFDELDCFGGAIRIAGKVKAFTLAEMLNADTAVVHIEKADAAISGLFQVINQEFCRQLAPGVEYVNREEDMGNAGLRKAKESYYPLRLIEKYELTIQT